MSWIDYRTGMLSPWLTRLRVILKFCNFETCMKFYFMKLATELGLDGVRPGNETIEYI